MHLVLLWGVRVLTVLFAVPAALFWLFGLTSLTPGGVDTGAILLVPAVVLSIAAALFALAWALL